MNIKEAISWMEQPGIKAIMPCDPHTQEALNVLLEQKNVLDEFQMFLQSEAIVGLDRKTNEILVGVDGVWKDAFEVFRNKYTKEKCKGKRG